VLFIVGCGRSGTTIVYEALASHSATAWCSTWADRVGHPSLALANPLFGWSRRKHLAGPMWRWLPRPSEGYHQWDGVLEVPPEDALQPLAGSLANASRRLAVDRMLDRYCRFGRGEVFVNKNTRNARRLDLLNALVPDCVVLHVLRHPLDTISSLLSVAWWPSLHLWTKDGRCPASYGEDAARQAELAAELWLAEVGQAITDGQKLGRNRYFEIPYESFVTGPADTISPILARLDLNPLDVPFSAALERVRASSVGTWRDRLDERQQRAAWSVAESLARKVGYVA
jgi:hypothetical protein